jgi:hypothetical protein
MAGLLLTVGCGGGSSATLSPGPLSGNWQFTLPQANANLLPRTQSGFLVQQKDALAGSMVVKASGCSGVGSVAGSVSGSNVALVTTPPTGLSVNLTGTIGPDNASMSGNYTILINGCNGLGPTTGTFTASLVMPLKGSFQGTFTSSNTGVVTPISGQVTQQTNPVGLASSAPVTGTLSAVNYCVSTASVSGFISGTDVALNLLAADGTQIGEVTGTASLDGTSVTGRYQILPQGKGAVFPCGSGDGGPATFTIAP